MVKLRPFKYFREREGTAVVLMMIFGADKMGNSRLGKSPQLPSPIPLYSSLSWLDDWRSYSLYSSVSWLEVVFTLLFIFMTKGRIHFPSHCHDWRSLYCWFSDYYHDWKPYTLYSLSWLEVVFTLLLTVMTGGRFHFTPTPQYHDLR
jgi:hypothetical protein